MNRTIRKAKNVILVVNVFEEQLKQKLVIENIASEEPVPGSAEQLVSLPIRIFSTSVNNSQTQIEGRFWYIRGSNMTVFCHVDLPEAGILSILSVGCRPKEKNKIIRTTDNGKRKRDYERVNKGKPF